MHQKRLAAALGGLLCAVALSYLAFKAWATGPEQGWDFRVVWVAGRVWLAGGDPYQGQAFFSTYAAQFGQAATFHQWFYPPNWYLLASALAAWPFPQATHLWGLISLLALVAGAALLARSAAPLLRRPATVLFAAQVLLLAALQDTAISLSIGQTSCLMYLGIACLVCAFLATPSRPWLLVIGLTLVALKPNIGLVLWLFAVGYSAWAGLAAATLLLLLLTLPALLANGVLVSLTGFLANLAHYRSIGIDANLPPDQTGVVNLLSLALGVTPSTGLLVATAAAAAWMAGLRARRAAATLESLLLVLALMLALVPLHSYDMVLMAIPLLALACARGAARWALLLAVLLMLRAPAVAERLGWQHPASLIFPGSLLESLGCVLLLLGCTLVSLRAQKKTPQG